MSIWDGSQEEFRSFFHKFYETKVNSQSSTGITVTPENILQEARRTFIRQKYPDCGIQLWKLINRNKLITDPSLCEKNSTSSYPQNNLAVGKLHSTVSKATNTMDATNAMNTTNTTQNMQRIERNPSFRGNQQQVQQQRQMNPVRMPTNNNTRSPVLKRNF